MGRPPGRPSSSGSVEHRGTQRSSAKFHVSHSKEDGRSNKNIVGSLRSCSKGVDFCSFLDRMDLVYWQSDHRGTETNDIPKMCFPQAKMHNLDQQETTWSFACSWGSKKSESTLPAALRLFPVQKLHGTSLQLRDVSDARGRNTQKSPLDRQIHIGQPSLCFCNIRINLGQAKSIHK